ncbi:hypothetical protein C0J52_04266 [Blattella germanica]|nr:hypothetical protein C0J52_04266 [Blattella germanica]
MEAFIRSPQKSTTRRSRGLGILQQNVWKILQQCLNFKLYHIQLLKCLKAKDYSPRLQFCTAMQEAMKNEDFAAKLIFSDECTMHLLSGVVKICNISKRFIKAKCTLHCYR